MDHYQGLFCIIKAQIIGRLTQRSSFLAALKSNKLQEIIMTNCIFWLELLINNINLMGKLKLWASEEDEVLKTVSNTIKSKRWKKASIQLKKLGFERTDVQCRQRYINHLDPSVNKQLWTDQQLQILYSKYKQYGNKWFLIQKHLPGRTQTKIKNYFYGNIRYVLKVMVKYFMKGSTGFLNDINTQTLVNIYESEEEYEGFGIVSKTIRRLRYKVEKAACQALIQENQEQFYQFIQYFLQKVKVKPSFCLKQESCQEQQLEESINSLRRIECQPLGPSLDVQVGRIEQVRQKVEYQLEYLRAMTLHHLKLHEHYQKEYARITSHQQE